MEGTAALLQRVQEAKTQLARYAETIAALARTRLPGNTPFVLFCLVLLAGPLLAALVFSLAYGFSFLYGLGGSYPCRQFFLWFPSLDALFVSPRSISEALFAYALLGAALAWLLSPRQASGKFFAGLGAAWAVFSLLFILSLVLATLGHVYVGFETPSYSLLGVLPHSDANAHTLSYSKYFHDFAMGDFALRRPLGAFLGAGIHWLAGADPEAALTLRCLLVGFAMWASCVAVQRAFGVWSALGCLALEYYHVGKFLGIGMTETLGFFWACCAVVLWLRALRSQSLFWELAAFSLTLIGLLTRMGSMFLLPALFLSILWRRRRLQPGRGWWKKPLASVCLCVSVVILLDASFARRGYGETNQTGSNFSGVVAALSLGTDFAGPLKLYAKELAALNGDKERSRFLYTQACQNILHHPLVFVQALVRGELAFLKNFHFLLFYNWWVVALLSLLLLLRRKTLFPGPSAWFWAAVWAGILLSIPVFYFVESRRVNIFVYPFIACFFSMALARPGPAGELLPSRGAVAWACLVLSAALLVLMTSVAWFPRLFAAGATAEVLAATQREKPARNTVITSREARGLLVIADGATPDPAVPCMPWSSFRARYRPGFPKNDAHFLDSLSSRLPFALLSLPVLWPANWDYGDAYFITPPEVLTDRHVRFWELAISRQVQDKRLHIRWNLVDRATPISLP